MSAKLVRVSSKLTDWLTWNHEDFKKRFKKDIYFTDYTDFVAKQLKNVQINNAEINLDRIWQKRYTVVKKGKHSKNISLRYDGDSL